LQANLVPGFSTSKKQLQNIRQGSQSCSDYLHSARSLADQLAIIGKPLDDEEFISFIVNGLTPKFNSLVASLSVTTREKSLSFEDFQDVLLDHEMLLNQQQAAAADMSTFALFAQKSGTRNPNQRQKGTQPFSRFPQHFNRPPQQFSRPPSRFNQYSKPPRGFPGFQPRPHPSSSMTNFNRTTPTPSFSNSTRTSCQICGRTNHQALDCFHRMNYSYQGKHPPP